MFLPGREVLEEGGGQEVWRNLALRFYLLDESPEQFRSVHRIALDGSSAYDHVKRFTASQLARHGTAFFWFYVHHMSAARAESASCTSILIRHFLIHLFDAFYHLLPDGSGVELPAVSDHTVSLPALGVLFSDLPRVRRLSKGANGEVRALNDRGGGEAAVHVANPGARRLPCADVGPRARLVLLREAALKDDIVSKRAATLSPLEGARLAGHIDASLGIVRAADPGLYRTLDGLIRWYFPLRSSKERNVDKSFAVATFHGGTFLETGGTFLDVLEAVVKEYFQNELWLATAAGPFVRTEAPGWVHSPWRTTPARVEWLFHGIYVYTGLLEFYGACEHVRVLDNAQDHFRGRRRHIHGELRTATEQLSPDMLTYIGATWLSKLKAAIERHGQELGIAACTT